MKRLTVAPRTPEWHEIRNDSWTASTGAVLVVGDNARLLQAHAAEKGVSLDIDPLLEVGLDSFYEHTPWKTWAEKVGRIPRFSGNAHTERGQAHEEFILRKFEADQMITAERDVTAVSSEYPWLLASFDGFLAPLSDPSVAAPHGFPVEAKCPAFPSRKKLWDSKSIGQLAIKGLAYYWVQVQHQLLVSEAPYGWFIAAGVEEEADGTPKLLYPLMEKVPRDERFLQAYLAIAEYYYKEFIEPFAEPPKLPSDEYLLVELAEQAAFDRALAKENSEEAVDLYLATLREEEVLTARRKELESKLLAAAEKMRAEGADFVCMADKIQVVYGKSNTVSWQKVAKELAKGSGGIPKELLEACTSERSSVKIKEV